MALSTYKCWLSPLILVVQISYIYTRQSKIWNTCLPLSENYDAIQKRKHRSRNSIEFVWIFQELFWKLVKLRVKPDNERITVLIHGAVNLDNIMFSYDELSGRPNQVLDNYKCCNHSLFYLRQNWWTLAGLQWVALWWMWATFSTAVSILFSYQNTMSHFYRWTCFIPLFISCWLKLLYCAKCTHCL